MQDDQPYRPPQAIADPVTPPPSTARTGPIVPFVKQVVAAGVVLPIGPLIWLAMLSISASLRGESPAIWNDPALWQTEFKDKSGLALTISGVASLTMTFAAIVDLVTAILKGKSNDA